MVHIQTNMFVSTKSPRKQKDQPTEKAIVLSQSVNQYKNIKEVGLKVGSFIGPIANKQLLLPIAAVTSQHSSITCAYMYSSTNI